MLIFGKMYSHSFIIYFYKFTFEHVNFRDCSGESMVETKGFTSMFLNALYFS